MELELSFRTLLTRESPGDDVVPQDAQQQLRSLYAPSPARHTRPASSRPGPPRTSQSLPHERSRKSLCRALEPHQRRRRIPQGIHQAPPRAAFLTSGARVSPASSLIISFHRAHTISACRTMVYSWELGRFYNDERRAAGGRGLSSGNTAKIRRCAPRRGQFVAPLHKSRVRKYLASRPQMLFSAFSAALRRTDGFPYSHSTRFIANVIRAAQRYRVQNASTTSPA